jgi:hypothetical protein
LGWNSDFERAGMPKGLWCREPRAGGLTEGGKAGVSKDDRRKVAGHAKEKQTEKYDRDPGRGVPTLDEDQDRLPLQERRVNKLGTMPGPCDKNFLVISIR